MNHSQRNLKKLIRAKEDSIADEELFLSAAYQKYQTSLARAVTGRYRYGLQVLLDWDISEQAGVAYTDNYKVHLNAANPITQSFPTRFLRSQSLTGLTGHEVGHLLYSDFTAHAVHLRSLENGSFYPKEPELSLPAYQTALEEIKEVLEEKDKAGCLTLARCAATFQNILEDIHIEDRMCEEFHGTFRQGIELNNLRMSEQIPSIQEQIDKEYQPFSIIANLILSYCRTGNINNPTGYQGDYLDTISDCTDLLDTAMESEKGTDRMLVSNALLALTWNYIQPLIEKTREELEMHGEDSAADALEDLLGDEVSSGAPLPTGKSGAIPKNIKPASPKGSGNDEGNAPSGPRTKEDAIEEAKNLTWHHDIGFIVNCSFGNGLRLAGTPSYKDVMVQAAKSLSTRFRPAAGIIQSWDVERGWQSERGWECPVIIDNMMNLELMFGATRLSGDSSFYKIAVSHADRTMEEHFRPDGSCYHVIDYSIKDGKVRHRQTAQGYADESIWSRGQAWAIYGYAVCYRETKDRKYLDQALKTFNMMKNLENMPEDLIPYWDMSAPNIPNEPRDVSTASCIASALYEISTMDVPDAAGYKMYADSIMVSLSSPAYRAALGTNGNFLLMHSVGSIPHNSEIDVPLNYADYYYLEALKRKRDIEKGL